MLKGLQKRNLGKTGDKVTFMGFGALEIGRDWGLGDTFERQRPEENAAGEVLNAVLDLGINIVDTASAYHRSEERIGKYISSRRSEFFLASKCGEHNNEPNTYYDFSYNAVKHSIDESLKKLKVDQIDLMQIHFGPDPQKVIDDGETVAAMKDAQKEGKIRFLGASTWGDIAKQCINSGDFQVMQLEYSLLSRGDENLVNLCGEKGIGVFLRGGLAYGRLTSRVIPHLDEQGDNKEKITELLRLVNNNGDMLTSLALNFLYKNPNVSTVLVGSKNIEHIRKNFELLERTIEPEIMQKAIDICK